MAPWLMAVRVVSFPAKTSRWNRWRYSWREIRPPSASALTRWVTRSSRGSALRLARISSPYSNRAWLAGLLKGSRRSSVVLPKASGGSDWVSLVPSTR